MALAEAVAAGKIPPSGISANNCLYCGKCEKVCPAKIKIVARIRAVRERIKLRSDLAFFLKNPKITETAQPFLALARETLAKGPAPAQKLANRLPPLARKPFGRERGVDGNKKTALLFAGCLNRRFLPEVARACAKVLSALGFAAESPRELVCCGRPFYLAGDMASARRAAKRNLEILAKRKFDFLVTACPSCSLAIKELWSETKLSSPARECLHNARAKLADIHALAASAGVKIGATPGAIWHNPCLFEPGDTMAARATLNLSDATDACCGAPLTLTKIGDTGSKMAANARNIVAARRVKTVVAACPACVLNLRRTFAARGDEIAVRHGAELMAAGFAEKAKPERKG